MKKENVWNYPRPAICEAFDGRLKIVHEGVVIADSVRGYRTVETSHPPSYYFPADDTAMALLRKNSRQTICEWKGAASYYDLQIGGNVLENIAWSYSNPTPSFENIKGFLSFYPSRLDDCFVSGEKVLAQPGDFYGGWITSNLQGPFKGGAGTMGW